MGGRTASMLALVALALIAMALAGCGGSSSGATGGSSESSNAGSTSSSQGEEGSTGSSKPAAGFPKTAQQASSGEEAEASEREAASEVLEENLQARAAGDFATQCETLAKKLAEVVEKNGGNKSCAEVLESESAGAPKGVLANTMTGPIAALRVEGNRAYALYHGKGGKDYAMKMELENGEWKVAGLLTEELG